MFSYFVEPDGFVTEYTTEVEQVDDSYVPHDAKWWQESKLFPCRWNMAGLPSDFARKAMSGQLVEEENLRCEQVMARRRAQVLPGRARRLIQHFGTQRDAERQTVSGR